MKHFTIVLGFSATLFATVWLTGCATDSPTQVKDSATAANKSALKPSVIYVTDFYLNPAYVTNERLLPKDGIIGSRLRELRDPDPAKEAQKLIRVLSESIVSELTKAGLKAEYLPNRHGLRSDFIPTDADLPKSGWIVGGWFTRVDEGNRVEEATIGFGAGQEQVETQVVVSDLAGTVNEPFLEIGSASARSMKPGGLAMGMNPYAMAAKYVLSRGATERDVKKQGVAIAKDLIQYINSGAPRAAK